MILCVNLTIHRQFTVDIVFIGLISISYFYTVESGKDVLFMVTPTFAGQF